MDVTRGRQRAGTTLLVSAVLMLLGGSFCCLDLPDEDISNHYRCEFNEDCIDGYVCNTDGYCESTGGGGGNGCEPFAYADCDGSDLYWFDSCDVRGDLKESCANCCMMGACALPAACGV